MHLNFPRTQDSIIPLQDSHHTQNSRSAQSQAGWTAPSLGQATSKRSLIIWKVRMRLNTSKPLKKITKGSYFVFILFSFREEHSSQLNPHKNSYKVRRLLISESCKILHFFGLRQTIFFWWINNNIILLTCVNSIPSCTNSIIIFQALINSMSSILCMVLPCNE